VFGADFGAARPIVLLLAPGVLATAVSILLTSYVAGVGRYQINTAAGIMGLLVTVVACWLLIPRWGIMGAAVAASLSYIISMTYLLRAFRKEGAISLRDLVPGKTELRYLSTMLRIRKLQTAPELEPISEQLTKQTHSEDIKELSRPY
jgi:O-antigen/teichoic acid export membrane protein